MINLTKRDARAIVRRTHGKGPETWSVIHLSSGVYEIHGNDDLYQGGSRVVRGDMLRDLVAKALSPETKQ